MLTLLVPILVNYLLVEPTIRSANKYAQSLHEVSLQWLMKIGPKYPQVFVFFFCVILCNNFGFLSGIQTIDDSGRWFEN